MKRLKLTVTARKVIGKKVKKLRKEGLLPANIYGKDIKSLSVQVPYKDFEKVYKEAGVTGVIDVEVDSQTRPSLIHNVQQDYYNHRLLHADFFQVNLKEKVKTMVKIVVVGEAKAVSEKLGLLLQPLSEVEIEALPTDLPEKIEVNVERLGAVNAQITVGEIKPPTGVTILTDPSQVVVKIGELISKEAAEQAAAEQAAAEAAKAATAPTPMEGTAPTEGAVSQPTAEAGKPSAGAPTTGKPEVPTAKEDTAKPQK
ncbi:MAG: 50S ribosomal protein L25 [Candidatus Levybacteria bacterium]|nr:50S ribosomal protein L25 [Candidatus Levybacteria bacterium]